MCSAFLPRGRVGDCGAPASLTCSATSWLICEMSFGEIEMHAIDGVAYRFGPAPTRVVRAGCRDPAAARGCALHCRCRPCLERGDLVAEPASSSSAARAQRARSMAVAHGRRPSRRIACPNGDDRLRAGGPSRAPRGRIREPQPLIARSAASPARRTGHVGQPRRNSTNRRKGRSRRALPSTGPVRAGRPKPRAWISGNIDEAEPEGPR